MSDLQLAFVKVNVDDLEAALSFWQEAFGFELTMSFDEEAFLEHALALPGQEGGPSLMLVRFKDGRAVPVGAGHGPVGFATRDIAAARARAIAAGARPLGEIVDAGPVRIAMLASPQGHEIELVQLPG